MNRIYSFLLLRNKPIDSAGIYINSPFGTPFSSSLVATVPKQSIRSNPISNSKRAISHIMLSCYALRTPQPHVRHVPYHIMRPISAHPNIP